MYLHSHKAQEEVLGPEMTFIVAFSSDEYIAHQLPSRPPKTLGFAHHRHFDSQYSLASKTPGF